MLTGAGTLEIERETEGIRNSTRWESFVFVGSTNPFNLESAAILKSEKNVPFCSIPKLSLGHCTIWHGFQNTKRSVGRKLRRCLERRKSLNG